MKLIGNCQLNENEFTFCRWYHWFRFSIKSQEPSRMLRLFHCRMLKGTFVPKGKEVQSRLEKHMYYLLNDSSSYEISYSLISTPRRRRRRRPPPPLVWCNRHNGPFRPNVQLHISTHQHKILVHLLKCIAHLVMLSRLTVKRNACSRAEECDGLEGQY